MEHVNLANNQVSHNMKIISGIEIRQSNPPNSLPKISGTTPSAVMEKRRRDGNHSLQKIIQYRIQW
jgi:hypothetical protein